MKQRTAILIAAVVTAFLLVTAGGVIARVAQAMTTTEVSTAKTSTSTVALATATLDPQMEALLQQREAQYQQQLQAANIRLQEAYAQQQALADQLAAAQAQTVAQPAAQSAASVASTGYAITPEQAVLVALGAAPGNAPVSGPELVSFQGTAAYEVGLSGGLVYVDATTGAVLYNGAVAAAISIPQLSGGSDHEHEEHEGGEDDHDD